MTAKAFSRGLAVALVVAFLAAAGAAQQFKSTGSRSRYVHRLPLLDALERPIDPAAENPAPYSPRATCKSCHDYDAIVHGWHSNAADATTPGRPGEPWLLADRRTGTQLPLSYRGWPGTWRPEEVGLDGFAFLEAFGRHLPGGSPTAVGTPADEGGFRSSGALELDCLACHDASGTWSHERWAKTVAAQGFAWAPTAASGLGAIDGKVERTDGEAAPDAAPRGPTVRYDRTRFDQDGAVFFDVVRRPTNEACYACHTTRPVGPDAPPRWLHDGDVHLRAGLACVDCHRSGIDHATVRGYSGEVRDDAASTSITCAGCHLDATDGHGRVTARGGRLGAPRPLHRGLPAFHLDELSCTACHAGPRPGREAGAVQTSLAHELGLPSQTRADDDLPLIVEPVLARGDDGVIRPHRAMWPAFWGWAEGDAVRPMPPADAYQTLRRALRIRQDLRAEAGRVALGDDDLRSVLGAERATRPEAERTDAERAALARRLEELRLDAFEASLVKGLQAFAKLRADAAPVYVASGRLHRLNAKGDEVESAPHAVAAARLWPLAHDVRPARDSLGVAGCAECHAADSPVVYGTVTPRGPLAVRGIEASPHHVRMGLDADLMARWETVFEGREPFKWMAFVTTAIIVLVLLLVAVLHLDFVGRFFRRGRAAERRGDGPTGDAS